MQKKLMLALLLSAAVLAAGSVETGPLERQVPPWQHLWEGLEPVDQGQTDGTSNTITTNEPNWALRGAGSGAQPREVDAPSRQQLSPLWGDDYLVGEPQRETSGRISVDYDPAANYIYVCLHNRSITGDDTLHVWRSTDWGQTWHKIIARRAVGRRDVQLLCGHAPNASHQLFIVYADSAYGLVFTRYDPDGTPGLSPFLTGTWKS
jgi:hypothetical protein